MKSRHIGRWLLTPDGAVEGYLRIDGDEVSELCVGRAPLDSPKAIISKGFVNAHTHVGDSIAYPAPRGTVAELVGPPDGYKHKILRSRSAEERAGAVRESVELMRASGTTSFLDFREEGLAGVRFLKDSLPPDTPKAYILGRPTSASTADGDLEELLEECDGIGMSAMRDWPAEFMERVSRRTRSSGKLFSLHASETVRESVDSLLDLKPDFVVHMTKASESDLARCGEANLQVVVCPRANEFFGLVPDIPMMLKNGLTVGLGTDNCMISRPDIIEEIKAAYRMSKSMGGITPMQAVGLAVFGGRKLLKAEGNIRMETRTTDDLVVLGVRGDDPLQEMVTSAGSRDILCICKGGKVWRTGAEWIR